MMNLFDILGILWNVLSRSVQEFVLLVLIGIYLIAHFIFPQQTDKAMGSVLNYYSQEEVKKWMPLFEPMIENMKSKQ